MDIIDTLKLLGEHPEGEFLKLHDFNQHHFGCSTVKGISPVWEMHPDTEEYFYIVAGEFEIVLAEPDGEKTYTASAGSSFVVPKNVWHKPGAPEGASFIYFTPGTSLHSEAKDPRES